MRKILSIHSSVMVGFVGNSVVAPVLSVLGHYPVMINTVTLAAHPGYGIVAGGPTPPGHIADFLAALKPLGQIDEIGHVVSGYMGSKKQLDVIEPAIRKWQKNRPDQYYIFDPVMGDAGHLYIDTELANAMRERLLPLANIITPNQFELGFLTDRVIDSHASALDAAAHLFNGNSNLQAVVATGIHDDGKYSDLLLGKTGSKDQMPALLSAKPAQPGAKNVSGGGDLLTALLVGYLASGKMLEDAFVLASKNTQMILTASTTGRTLALRENLTKLAE